MVKMQGIPPHKAIDQMQQPDAVECYYSVGKQQTFTHCTQENAFPLH